MPQRQDRASEGGELSSHEERLGWVEEQLRRHFTHGRLDVEDYEARLERAHGARTPEALSAVVSDLPEVDAEGRRMIARDLRGEASREHSAPTSTDEGQRRAEVNALAVAAPPPLPEPVPRSSDELSRPEARPSRALVRRERGGRIVAVLGEVTRRGRWRPSSTTRVITVFGQARLDMRQAELGAGTTELRVLAVFGATQVVVPRGLTIETEGVAILGSFDDGVYQASSEDSPSQEAHAGRRLRITGYAVFGSVEVVVAPEDE